MVVPVRIPDTVADFTGRASLVADLTGRAVLRSPVIAVAGIGGVGKTTLAVHVAHATRESFPDGELYADLHGGGPSPTDPGTLLRTFLQALGAAESAIPEGLEQRAALYRTMLSGRRVLILLDNARDAAQVRPLLPGKSGCTVLITSRARMTALAGAHLVDLEIMEPGEALTLFSRIAGERRVTGERPAALDAVAACGFLPLAIRVAASRLVARSGWTVSGLADRLADEHRRLDELQAGEQAVKATFQLGYGQLDQEQRRAFRLLGLADGPDIATLSAAALLDRDAEATEHILESLVDSSLLESAAPDRYRLHDLVRLFARDRAVHDAGSPGEGTAALSRLLDFYLATATRVFAFDHPGDRTAAHLAPAVRPGLAVESQEAALDWLYTEAGCLMACAAQSAARGAVRRAADLLVAVKGLVDYGDHAARYERCARAVGDAAARAGDPRAEARARVMLTHAYTMAGRFPEADAEACRARRLGVAAGDPLSSAFAANDRGILATYLGRYEEAQTHLEQAVADFRSDGNHPSEASALCNFSRVHVALRRYDSAIELARRGLAIYRDTHGTLRMGNARYTLGVALARAGRTAEGVAELTRALAEFRVSRQPRWEGVTHFRLAEAHLDADRPDRAAAHAERALALSCIGGEWRRGTVLVALGRSLDALGETSRARESWRDALSIFEEGGWPEAGEVAALLSGNSGPASGPEGLPCR